MFEVPHPLTYPGFSYLTYRFSREYSEGRGGREEDVNVPGLSIRLAGGRGSDVNFTSHASPSAETSLVVSNILLLTVVVSCCSDSPCVVHVRTLVSCDCLSFSQLAILLLVGYHKDFCMCG